MRSDPREDDGGGVVDKAELVPKFCFSCFFWQNIIYQDIFYKLRAANFELRVSSCEFRVASFEFYCFD